MTFSPYRRDFRYWRWHKQQMRRDYGFEGRFFHMPVSNLFKVQTKSDIRSKTRTDASTMLVGRFCEAFIFRPLNKKQGLQIICCSFSTQHCLAIAEAQVDN